MKTSLAHVVVALAGMAAVSTLAAIGTVPGGDALAVVIGVLTGAGVLAGAAAAGAAVTNASSTLPPPPSIPKGAPQ